MGLRGTCLLRDIWAGNGMYSELEISRRFYYFRQTFVRDGKIVGILIFRDFGHVDAAGLMLAHFEVNMRL